MHKLWAGQGYIREARKQTNQKKSQTATQTQNYQARMAQNIYLARCLYDMEALWQEGGQAQGSLCIFIPTVDKDEGKFKISLD